MATTIPCTKTETLLFDPAPEQVVIKDSTFETYSELSTLDNASAITINIPGSSDYVDLHNCRLELGLKITKPDGSNLAADTKVAFVNCPFTSVLKDISVYFGERLVSGGDDYTAYKNYILTELGYGSTAKNITLRTIGYAKDTTGQMDVCDDDNAGFKTRMEWAALSSVLCLKGPIPVELFATTEKYLCPFLNIRFVLKLNSPEFALMAASAFRYKVTHCKVKICKVKLDPTVALALENEATKSGRNMLLPFTRYQVAMHSISRGDRNATIQSIFPDQKPKQVLVTLVDAQAVTGDIKKNPYKFQHFDLDKISLKHGSKIISGEAMEPQDPRGGLIDCYSHLLEGRECFARNSEIGITLEDFTNDRRIYCFTLAPDFEISGIRQPRENGGLTLELSFSTGLPLAINVIILACFDNTIQVSGNRAVMMDY